METNKPLQVTVRPKGPTFVKKFAEEVLHLFAQSDRVEAVATSEGLVLSAVWEPDLEEAIELLRRAATSELVYSSLTIHYVQEPRVLEPILKIVVRVVPDFMGNVIGDISNRRGLVLGMEEDGSFLVISANIPLAELIGYGSALRHLSNGTATASATFVGYEPAPGGDGPGKEPKSAAMRA